MEHVIYILGYKTCKRHKSGTKKDYTPSAWGVGANRGLVICFQYIYTPPLMSAIFFIYRKASKKGFYI